MNKGSSMSLEVVSASSLWVGNYRRRMKVSLERMYENALDWAHLPFLHSSAFSSIDLIDSGDWGWRAGLGLAQRPEGGEPPHITLQLSLDRTNRRWISSTLEGPGAGSEIWTHVFEFGPRDLEIQADFFIPGVTEVDRAATGAVYAALYQGLYDEDEAMMLERQRAIDEQAGPEKKIEGSQLDDFALGRVSSLDANLPFDFRYEGQPWRLIRDEEAWLVYTLTCPHLLGSFKDAVIESGTVTCPWHGYRFSLRTGECLSGADCQLPDPPKVIERAGWLYIQGMTANPEP